jgi:hypothetical protein
MDRRATELERAFQLATSGRSSSVDDIRKQLRKERYTGAHITGKALMKQLTALIQRSRVRPGEPQAQSSRPPV